MSSLAATEACSRTACHPTVDVAHRIHEAALSLLADPGVRVEHEAIRDLLLRSGARAGAERDVIRFPQALVEECLQQCPSEVHLADRKGQGRVIHARSAPAIWSVPGLHMLERGEHRPFTARDMARVARLLDHLVHVDGVFGFSLNDVPAKARDVVGLSIMAQNTSKHIRVLCFSPAGADALVEMKRVVGDFPWFSVGFTSHGPLRWTHLALEIFQRTAGHGIPTTVNGEPMAGVSGPVTLAGSAAVGTAEILSGIVINQLLEPGRPCIFNLGLAHVFDMRTAIAVTGGPENALYAQLSAALGRHYNLPSSSWVSTESMCEDAQAGLEKMFGFQAHMASGVSNIWAVGQLESELTFSPAQAVIDNEMIAYTKRFLRGVTADDASLALEVTREVGIAGSFLDTLHTAEHFRDELFMPDLLLRKTRDAWQAEGGKRLHERAADRAVEFMAMPVDPGMRQDQMDTLQRLADAFVVGQA